MTIFPKPVAYLLLLILLLSAACATLPPKCDYPVVTAPGQPFEGERALAHVTALTAPEMEGRQSGLSGAERAEAYAADQFRRWGLEPAGDDGTYMQTFPMLVTELRSAKMTVLDTLFSPIELTLHEAFYPLTHSGSGRIEGEAVFVGYGISKPDKGWDDYGDADVNGKVVVIIRDRPSVPGQDWSAEYSRNYTVREAVDRGATGILFLQGKRLVHGAAISKKAYEENTPMAYMAEHVADTLLAGRGETLESYKAALKKAPKLISTGCRVQLRFQVPRIVDGHAANVIGRLPGADPVLNEEYIVIGGHLDHLGVCPGGIPFDGANDNASGSSVVLELARAFAEAPVRPARTLVFALFAAEEQGLLGSEYMANHLPMDKDKVVLMINYDMAGHGNGSVGFGGTEAFPVVWRSLLADKGEAFTDRLYLSRAWGGGSDQASFRAVGVPAFSIWSRGDHRFYHSVHDILPYIKTDVIHAVGTASETAIRCFADWPHSLAGSFQEERQMLAGSCQVDFSTLWSGLSITEKELTGPVATGRIFVHGAFWNLAVPSWLDGSEKTTADPEPGSASAVFSLFSKLKNVSLPAAVAGGFSKVRGNVGKQRFTLLPCITPDLLEQVGPAGAAYLEDLGAAFVVAGSKSAVPTATDSPLPVIARLEQGASTGQDSNGSRIFLCSSDIREWLASAGKLKNEKTLFVIQLDSEEIEGKALIEAIEALQPARCHLDLSGIAQDRDDEQRLIALFHLLRSLKEAGMDRSGIEALIGRNLTSWPG